MRRVKGAIDAPRMRLEVVPEKESRSSSKERYVSLCCIKSYAKMRFYGFRRRDWTETSLACCFSKANGSRVAETHHPMC